MAARIYRLPDGTRVPSVTGVLAKFKDPGGLMYWAWNLGIEGKDYRQVKEEAADAGTLAHFWIEKHLEGVAQPTKLIPPDRPAPDAGMFQSAYTGYTGFLSWREASKLDVDHRETELISLRHRFGGCLDAVGHVAGTRALVDWKTSNAVYSEYLAQVGGYAVLWDEAHPEDPIRQIHLLRFSKDDGSFHHHGWGEDTIELAKATFLNTLALYGQHAALKRRL